MGEPHHQFPQPTRPLSSYDVDPNPEISEEKRTQDFPYPEALELPKSGNFNFNPLSHNTEKQLDDSYLENMNNFTITSDPWESSSSQEFYEEKMRLSPSVGKTPKSEREAVDELLLILIECMEEVNTKSRGALLKKFFAEIEKEERFEKFIIERLRQSKVKAISEMCEKVAENFKIQNDSGNEDDDLVATRSVYESVEELSQKLERFKVRTFEGDEVVKEEVINSK